MNRKIQSVFIKNLFDTNSIFWQLNDVNVLVGRNGSGKSTILQLIKSCVTDECNYEILDSCEGMQIGFKDKNNENIINSLFSPKTIKSTVVKSILESDIFKSNLPSLENKIINNSELNQKFKSDLSKSLISETLINDYLSKQINKNIVKLQVEYISTINMSANSISNQTRSDGKIVNFLDSEILEELNKLLTLKESNKNKEKLITVLNNMFSDTGKRVKIMDNKLLFTLKNGNKIELKNLSSGERQIIYIFIKVINASNNNALILMDEPEISLHLSWQEKLLTEIRNVNKGSQIIIVTHSPAIVMNGWMDSFVDIKDIISEQ